MVAFPRALVLFRGFGEGNLYPDSLIEVLIEVLLVLVYIPIKKGKLLYRYL